MSKKCTNVTATLKNKIYVKLIKQFLLELYIVEITKIIVNLTEKLGEDYSAYSGNNSILEYSVQYSGE